MSPEVLLPQDLLGEKIRIHATSFHRRRTVPANGSLAMKRKQQGTSSSKHDKMRSKAASEAKKSSSKHDKMRSKAASEAKKSIHGGVADQRSKGEITSGGLVMGQVTLLRRGESLSSLASKMPKSSETQKIVPEKSHFLAAPVDTYAGSAYFLSPSPRSLPQPTFFNKKDDADSFEDGATRFLRRALRLE